LYDIENYFVVCSFDTDDLTMNNQEVIERLNTYKNVFYYFGESVSKIDAINRDIDKFPDDWSILVNFSDDQVFTSLYFDRTIREAMINYYPNGDGVLHFPDQKTRASLITMSIMDKKYFLRDNFIYNPVYTSLYCDSEFQDVAKIRGRYVYVGVDIFKHLHPAWGLAKMDAQYQPTESFYNKDGSIYRQRKEINFGIKIQTNPKLSILICLTPDRIKFFPQLIRAFDKQLPELLNSDYEKRNGYDIFRFTYGTIVEICVCLDDKILTVGEKRNILNEWAKGDYVAHFDSDDLPSDCYIEENMKGINLGVDCCSLIGEMTTNGKNAEVFKHYKDCQKYDKVDGVWVRYPNHLNCIKASIAKQFKFPEISFSEDTAWATLLHNSGLIKTEYLVEKTIYYYRYISNKD